MISGRWKATAWPLAAVLLWAAAASAQTGPVFSSGQTVYVPVYSHIYSGDRERPFYLAVTLSIRNTDPEKEIVVTRADYYASDGGLIKAYAQERTLLKPLSTVRFVVPESDKTGGSGASFLVAWESESAVSAPVVESVMIGTSNQQGVSFTSRGVVVRERSQP